MFSTILKELRQSRSITQQEISDATKISRSIISQYENGITEPTANVILKLAEFFNVSTDYLLGKSDELGGSILPNASAPLPNDEQRILALYRKMTRGQKIQFVAYGEGLMGLPASSSQA